MVAGRKKMTAGWVGTLTVCDGLHGEFAKLDVSVPVLVEGAQKARWAEIRFRERAVSPARRFPRCRHPRNATPPQ